MKSKAVVIYTDHALTKNTQTQYEICELDSDQSAVRRTGTNETGSFRQTVMIETIVTTLAQNGRIYDKGYWLVTWKLVGMKVTMTAIPLYTQE